MKEKILIFQQIVPAYRVPVFRAMHLRFNSLLCHSSHNKLSKISSAADSIDFPNKLIKNYDALGTWQVVIPTLIRYRPRIVIAGAAVTNFTFIKLLFLKFIFHYKLIAWGHGVNNKELNTPLQGLRGRIMKFFLKKADAIIFYSEKRKDLVEQILPSVQKKSFVAWNTLDLTLLKPIYSELQKRGQQTVKRELGKNFNAQYNLIFIGRLLPDKRVDVLLDIMDYLVNAHNVALHIIGDGAEKTRITQHQLFNKNIFHYGAIYDDTITGKYLFASDLFVMPGYIGLSMLHAFAFGVPVVTCKSDGSGPFHSPEIEYLQNHYNGILGSKTSEKLAEIIKDVLHHTDKLKEMKKNAERTAYETCTLERMIRGFEQAINFVGQ